MPKYHSIEGRALLFLFFLWSLWFVTAMSRHIFSPILPLIEDEFSISHARASSLFTSTVCGSCIALLFSGAFAGRFGLKRFIIAFFLIGTTACVLIPYVKNFYLLQICAFFLGLPSGAYPPCILPLITESFEEKDWGKAITIHDSAAPVSIFLMPLITIPFLIHFQWKRMFDLIAGAFLLGSFVFYRSVNEMKLGNPEKHTFKDVIKIKNLWIMAGMWIMAAGASMGLYSILPLYLTKELHLELLYANKIFGLSRLGGVFVAIGLGFFINRLSIKRTLFSILLFTGIMTIFLSQTKKFLFPVLFLQACASQAFFPIGLVAISNTFEREKRSMATGIILTAGAIVGQGVFPYLLGLAGDSMGFRYGIMVLGSLTTLFGMATLFMAER